MYAECPHCHAIFRVNQEILSQAKGRVRCGQCKEIFAAVEETSPENKTTPSETLPLPDIDATVQITTDSSSAQPSFVNPDQPSQYPQRAKLKIPDIFPANLSEFLPVTYSEPRKKFKLPFSLRVSPSIIAFSLVLLFFAQYIRTHRVELSTYAALRPPIKALCAISGCEIHPKRNLKKIKLLNHGVYAHPNIKDALIIKASMVNRADFEQDYPIVQVKLGNIKGQTIAMRRFNANEYLDDSVPLKAKMPIGQSIPILIEVADPGEKALGFEFEFL